MKVEDPPAFLVQWFHHKTQYLPKEDGSSWQNYTRFTVRNATTIILFIVTAKIKLVSKNISAANAVINLPRMHLPVSLENRVHGRILPVLSVERPLSCTMTRNITATTAAVTRSVTILCSCQSLPLSRLRPCQSCSARRTSNGCAILSMSSSWPCPCSTWAKTPSAISL